MTVLPFYRNEQIEGVNLYAIGDRRVAELAQAAIGNEREYNFVMDNCHQFAAGCILDDFDNANNFLVFLKHTVEMEMNDGNTVQWLAWDWRK